MRATLRRILESGEIGLVLRGDGDRGIILRRGNDKSPWTLSGRSESQRSTLGRQEVRVWTDKSMMVHRKGGPALEYANGFRFWYLRGKLQFESTPKA